MKRITDLTIRVNENEPKVFNLKRSEFLNYSQIQLLDCLFNIISTSYKYGEQLPDVNYSKQLQELGELHVWVGTNFIEDIELFNKLKLNFTQFSYEIDLWYSFRKK